MSLRRRDTFFILFFISALISISGNSYALMAWGDDARECMRDIAIQEIIPSDWPVRYDSQDMMVFEKFVDRQSRRALKAYAEPDQQAVISYKDGVETLIVETARFPEGRAVLIMPVPSNPEVEEGNQDIFPEFSNKVFYRLFGGSEILTTNFEYTYQPEKVEKSERIKQRAYQRTLCSGKAETYLMTGIKSKESLNVHRLPCADVLVLNVGNSEEFIAFFNENFYKITDSQKPVIDYYIKKNWRFAIIRVRYPETGEINPPVKLTFKTPEIMFPLKICQINNPGSETTNINLFVFSDKDFGAKNFYRVWRGDKKEIAVDLPDLPHKLTVLTGIVDNERKEGDLVPTSARTSAWILPVSRDNFGFYLFITILWLIIIFAVLYLEKLKYIKPVSMLCKAIAVYLLIPLVVLSVVSVKDKGSGNSYYIQCQKNTKELATALEMYSTDNGGKYPDRLGKLVPDYVSSIPNCPDSGSDSYSYPSYRQNKTIPSLSHRLICRNRHSGVMGRNRKPVVFPLCGEVRIILDDGK